jgi:hypothetical protein
MLTCCPVDHVDEGAVVAELDRRGRGQHHLFEGVGQQAHVDELVGEQRWSLFSNALELQGAGGGVDLVVEAAQHAGGLELASPRSQASTGRLAPLR